MGTPEPVMSQAADRGAGNLGFIPALTLDKLLCLCLLLLLPNPSAFIRLIIKLLGAGTGSSCVLVQHCSPQDPHPHSSLLARLQRKKNKAEGGCGDVERNKERKHFKIWKNVQVTAGSSNERQLKI